jgi:hypothetical protein
MTSSRASSLAIKCGVLNAPENNPLDFQAIMAGIDLTQNTYR